MFVCVGPIVIFDFVFHRILPVIGEFDSCWSSLWIIQLILRAWLITDQSRLVPGLASCCVSLRGRSLGLVDRILPLSFDWHSRTLLFAPFVVVHQCIEIIASWTSPTIYLFTFHLDTSWLPNRIYPHPNRPHPHHHYHLFVLAHQPNRTLCWSIRPLLFSFGSIQHIYKLIMNELDSLRQEAESLKNTIRVSRWSGCTK